MRLLVIEDDPMIGKSIREGLRREGYAVDWVRDGWAGERTLNEESYDVMLLDLGLPRKKGLDVLTAVRAAGKDLPVLIITARDSVDDRVRGLDAGADDYLMKPFSMAELSARVRVLLRRRSGNPEPVLRSGAITLNAATRDVRVNGEAVVLSQREFSLMQRLMLRPGAVVSRGALEQSLYGWGEEIESNAIEVYISNLRKKLGAAAIEKIRGIGCRMAQP